MRYLEQVNGWQPTAYTFLVNETRHSLWNVEIVLELKMKNDNGEALELEGEVSRH